jgi:hypothetical protein
VRAPNASTALLAALTAISVSAEVIPATVASSQVGRATTVEGVVSEVHIARSAKETFVDVGGMYPKQIFTAVIFRASHVLGR